MTDWQPIETAPKDGTEVLITDGETCAVASWSIIAAEQDFNDGVGWRDTGDIGWGGMQGPTPDPLDES